MRNILYSNPQLFEAFIKMAQYMARLKSQQDIWQHLGAYLVSNFPVTWTAFAHREGGTILIHNCSSSEIRPETLLTDRARSLIGDVLDNGFLASEVLTLSEPSQTVFLPIVENYQPSRVMLIGHKGTDRVSNDVLNVYLAIAGLAGTALERLHNERELSRHRANLEELVRERTTDLAHAIRQNDLILRSAAEGICGIDLEGRITFANPASAQFLGYTVDELIGCNGHDTFHHSHADGSAYSRENCPVFLALKESRSEDVSGEEFVRKDGTRFPVEFTVSPISEAGKVVGGVMVFRDIGERMRSEMRMELLADTASALLRTETPQRLVNSLCQKALRLLDCDTFFNFMVDEQRGRLHLNACGGISPEEARKIEWLDYGVAICGCVARDGVRLTAEDIQQSCDPRTDLVKSYGVQAYACHPLIVEGKVLGTLSFGTRTRTHFHHEDLAVMKAVADLVATAVRRKRSEHELQRLKGELEKRVESRTAELMAANHELEAFGYSVSHDLRAPLRHVTSFIKLLKKNANSTLGEQNLRYINTIEESGNRMGRLLDGILVLSRLGRATMSETEVPLRQVMDEARQELATIVSGRNIEWRIDALPVVRGDATLLRSACANLLSNAIKYTRGREPALIELGSREEDTQVVCFVRDNGAGFEMQFVNKLFGVFQRLHTADEFEGTGIGLASVRRIIQRHGGLTWAEGHPNQGATFYFSFPKERVI